MKNIIYFFLIFLFTSCSNYYVIGQSPYQYTSVSDQIIISDQIDEPFEVQNVYINYVPTLSFTTYYSYNYWRPHRIFYNWMYSSPYYWQPSYYNYLPYNNWYYHHYTNWNHNPYYWYNWSSYGGWNNPYTNNFNSGCYSPFYKQNTHNWKTNLQQPHVDLNKLAQNNMSYASKKPQHTNYSSDNAPKRPSNVTQRNNNISNYERPIQRTYSKPEKVEYRNKVTQPQRPTYQRQERNYQPRTPQVPTKNPPSSRPSYNKTPRISSPSPQPSRSTYQPRTNYGGTRSNFGVKGGR